MALILSIETSTKTSSIAIHEKGELIASQHIHIDKSHSEYLTLSIKYLFETSGFNLNDLEAVAISKGPGSYTGLRIGTSSAKGICYALDIKLIGINTLEAMALGISPHYSDKVILCPMIDARRMEVYCLLNRPDMSNIEETQSKIIDKHSFENYLMKHKVVFFGNGAGKCREVIQHPNAIFIEDIHPSSEHIGSLAWQAFQNQKFENLAYFEPFYLKDFIAKKPSAKNLV